MKKYLFGLGAMLVGAGLMFVLMHGEVSAEKTSYDSKQDFICKSRLLLEWDEKEQMNEVLHVKYKAGTEHIKTSIVRECRKEDKKENTTCYIFIAQDNPAISCLKTKSGLFK